MALFQEIAIALVNESKRRQIEHFPNGVLAVNVADWETKAADMTFDLWPCPANPTASWDAEKAGTGLEYTPTLAHINVDASRVRPTPWPDPHPEASINSNFVDVLPGHGSGGRFWAESKRGLRAPGLYLPAPGMAQIWPRLAGIPNVTVWLTYSGGIHVLLASRFDKDCTQHRSHNVHLFDMPVPRAWGEGKQFGDPRKSKRVQRRRPKKHEDDD